MGLVPQCSSRQDASTDMHMAYLGHTVTLTWRDLRSNFKIDLSRIKTYGSIRLDERRMMVSKLFPGLSSWSYSWKIISKKNIIFPFWWPLVLTVLDLRVQIASGDPVLSFGYLTILLASIVLEIIAIFCENSPILRKFDIFWPPVTSNVTWSKNDLSMFCRICRGLSNTVYRFSLSFLVFEFSGGRASAPPPGPCEGGSD